MKAVNHGFESLRYLGPEMWEVIPSHLKEIDSLKNFRNVIKKRKPESAQKNIYSKHRIHVGLYRKNLKHFFNNV